MVGGCALRGPECPPTSHSRVAEAAPQRVSRAAPFARAAARMFTTGKAHFGVGAGIPLDWFWRARMVAAVERGGSRTGGRSAQGDGSVGRLPARWVEQSAVTSPTGQRHPCL